MAYRERINPKNGNKEYKVRYYFMADGKKRDSETAWFDSLEKAQKEAKKMKEDKERADRNKRLERRDKLLLTAFEEFTECLKEKSSKKELSTDVKNYKLANSIRRHHMPDVIQNTKIKDVDTITFKVWHSAINKKESIGGAYMRQCRHLLMKFNNWLSENNYYNDEYIEENIKNALSNSKLKSINYRNKEDNGERHILTTLDIEKLTNYYYQNGIEEFSNFYYYTLFYTFFFSGVRVEELAALQWKFIDLRENQRIISIKNAIPEQEGRDHARERVKNENYKTKNAHSVRMIPIFDYYYGLLIDYKESYKYEYNLSNKELEECFVFPNLHNPHNYLSADIVRKELNSACKELGIKKTDLQMFRHSTATFLILPPPDGLGYTEEKVKDYFGHVDTSMLNRVYAKLSMLQKTERMRMTFSDIYKPKESAVDIEKEMKMKLLARISGDNEEAKKVRKDRVYRQINKAIDDNRNEYFYNTRDKEFIEDYIKEHGEDEINFIYME